MDGQIFDCDSFKLRDASSYDSVTDSFDRFTERLTKPLARRLVELADLRGAERILDIGSGTGVVAFEAAAASTPDGQIIGVDLSEGMLRLAESKRRERGLDRKVRFVKGDVEALEFADSAFDRVLLLFAIMHFPNPEIALAQMHRVLRPGGKLVIGFGSGPPLFSPGTIFHFFRRIPELSGRLRGAWLSAPAFLEGLVHKHLSATAEPEESPLARSGQIGATHIRRMVREAGFQNLQSSWQGHVTFVATAEEFWELQTTYSSLARKRLTTAPAVNIAALKSEFFAICERVQKRKGRFAYPYGAHFITAIRPLRI